MRDGFINSIEKNAVKIKMFSCVLIKARALMPAIWMPRWSMKGKISLKVQLSHLAKIKETPGGKKLLKNPL